VGPFQSGKTTLLEAILARTGAVQRQGTVEAGTTVGDGSKEARHHLMSVELSAATTTFMGESFTFIDCPGSVEFAHDMRAALPAVDAAVVVCEMDEKKVPQLQQGRFHDSRGAQAVAAGLAAEAAAASDPDLLGRPHHRLRRSRA
jgi:elongation factor G